MRPISLIIVVVLVGCSDLCAAEQDLGGDAKACAVDGVALTNTISAISGRALKLSRDGSVVLVAKDRDVQAFGTTAGLPIPGKQSFTADVEAGTISEDGKLATAAAGSSALI